MELMKVSVVLLVMGLAGVMADTPANCTYEDIKGDWIFYETERTGNSSIDCSKMGTLPEG